jgi:hypothetical protein
MAYQTKCRLGVFRSESRRAIDKQIGERIPQPERTAAHPEPMPRLPRYRLIMSVVGGFFLAAGVLVVLAEHLPRQVRRAHWCP